MTFTYSGNPEDGVLDAIRFEVQDTKDEQHLLEDEEIGYVYARTGNIYKAAAQLCENLAARFARDEGFRGATIQTNKTTISAKYLAMAKRLRARSLGSGAFVSPALDADRDPKFVLGVHDNPEIAIDTDSNGV